MADVQPAWIAAGASLAVSLISLGSAVWANLRSSRMQREQAATAAELEKLKSHLSAENDAAKAKRDYEYDARKRLYAELYPLAFQLHEAALSAQNRIINLALATRGGFLAAGPDNWLTGADPYYFASTVHALVAPLAIVELMTRKLTMLDLTLDQSLRRQHFIGRRAYEALRSDFNLVDRRFPPLAFGPGDPSYAPPEVRPAALPPEVEQRWRWRQGLYSGQISQAVDAVLTLDGGVTRAMTYAEFTKALAGTDLRTAADPGGKPGEMKRALQPLTDVLRDFHPARRPVTWRILLAQGACYRAIAAAAQSDRIASEEVLRAALYADAKDLPAFEWIGGGMHSIPPALRSTTDFEAEQKSAFATANLYVKGVFEDFARRYTATA